MTVHTCLSFLSLRRNRFLDILFLWFFVLLPSMAVDNLFFDGDYSPDDIASVASNPLSFNDGDPSFTDNNDSVFNVGSSPVLGQEPPLGGQISGYDELNEDDYGSMKLALGNSCSSSDPKTVNKRRIKSREQNDVCMDENSLPKVPDNFRDLAGALQAEIFQNFMCPTSRFHLTYRPVCSSPNEDDTQMLGYLSGWTVPVHFTLLHSVPMTWLDAWACSGLKAPYCCLAWTPDFVDDQYGPRLGAFGTGVVCYEMTTTLDIFRGIVPQPY